MPRLALILSAVASAWLLAGVVWLAARRPTYRHVRDTISELGETGAPDQRLCAWGLFLPVGLLLLASAAGWREAHPWLALLALCLGLGYVGAAAFPCDPGSPLSGSTRQDVHNLAGGIEYVGGAWALYRLAETAGPHFRIAGFVVFGAVVALSFRHPWRGAVQRVAEVCLFGGLLAAAWR